MASVVGIRAHLHHTLRIVNAPLQLPFARRTRPNVAVVTFPVAQSPVIHQTEREIRRRTDNLRTYRGPKEGAPACLTEGFNEIQIFIVRWRPWTCDSDSTSDSRFLLTIAHPSQPSTSV